jgi:hypothetical protein
MKDMLLMRGWPLGGEMDERLRVCVWVGGRGGEREGRKKDERREKAGGRWLTFGRVDWHIPIVHSHLDRGIRLGVLPAIASYIPKPNDKKVVE